MEQTDKKGSGFVDCHCHLSDLRIPNWRPLVDQAVASGIRDFLMAGVDAQDWIAQAAIHQSYSRAWTCFGLHPYRTALWSDEACERDFKILKSAVHEAQAVGETGLDFRKNYKSQAQRQEKYFRQHIELAIEHSKVLVLHIVQAHGKALEILAQYSSRLNRGVIIHAFNGSREVAEQYISLGCFLSLGGAVTHQRNRKLREAIPNLALDAMLIETDSPDQPPAGWKGEINTPLALFNIAEEISQFKRTEPEQLLQQTSENFRKLFQAEYEKAQL